MFYLDFSPLQAITALIMQIHCTGLLMKVVFVIL